jgi:hypothetical protein
MPHHARDPASSPTLPLHVIAELLCKGRRRRRSGHDPIPAETAAGDPLGEEVHVEAVETYTSVLTVLSVALLLVVAGVAKKQLVWKAKPLPARRRRR